jgi:hypothetical protein
MGIFSKFSLPFSLNKKTEMLPEPRVINAENTQNVVPYKTLATFELKLEEPKIYGELPETTIKFYPLK